MSSTTPTHESDVMETKPILDDEANLNNVTSDTIDLSMDQSVTAIDQPSTSTSSPVSSSGAVLIPPEELNTHDSLDPDIDIAAEQIVNEFTEHLSQRSNHQNMEYKYHPSNTGTTNGTTADGGVGEEVVGLMSPSMAAGGFEELIVALDQQQQPIKMNNNGNPSYSNNNNPTPTNYNDSATGSDMMVEEIVEDMEDDDDDIVEEEVVDSSYDEEEITDNDEVILDDCDIEEIMEESGMIIAEGEHARITTSAVDNEADVISLPEENNDAIVTPNDDAVVTPMEENKSTDELNEKSVPSTTTTVNGNVNEVNSTGEEYNNMMGESGNTMDAYGAATTIATTANNSLNDSLSMDVSETSNYTEMHHQEPLYGDVLLGEMSEMTSTSKNDTYFSPNMTNNILDRSNNTGPSKSSRSDPPVFSSPALNTSANTPAPPHEIKQKQQSKNNDLINNVATAGVATAAVGALAHENHGGQNPTMFNANNTPVPPALQNPPRLSSDMMPKMEPSATYSNGIDNSGNIIDTTEATIPVPPAMSGSPSLASFHDLESGRRILNNNAVSNDPNKVSYHVTDNNLPEMAQSNIPVMNDPSKKKEENEPDDGELPKETNLAIYAGLLLLLLTIFLAVILGVVLKKDNDTTKEIMVPTASPIVMVAPSNPPVIVTGPPTVLQAWTESIPPVFGSIGSEFGTSIILDSNKMWSIGAPRMIDSTTGLTSGAVATSTNNDGSWELVPMIFGKSAGDGFGSAIDMSNNHMVVGAPFVLINNTSTSSGAAYYYTYNSTNNVWEERDYVFRSNDDLLSTNGEFGEEVSLGFYGEAGLPRVAIGAPKYNLAMDAVESGRVFTFEAGDSDGSSWSALESKPLFGKNAYDLFGASIDMSPDGTLFIVGAPGINSSGYFQIYEWIDDTWEITFEQDGNAGEGFGSSVVVVSENLFAVGGPGYNDGSGRVVVYERKSVSEFVQFGEIFFGDPGDRLGSPLSVTAGKYGDDEKTILILATENGVVYTYVLNEASGIWKPSHETLLTGTNSSVVVAYSKGGGLITGYPAGDEVSFYNGTFVAAPTTSPVSTTNVPTPMIAPNSSQTPLNTTTSPTVAPAETNSTSEQWVVVGESFTPVVDDGSGYGASVSLTPTTMVIGAPKTLGNGAVFFYMKDTTTGTWNTAASKELFGSAPDTDFGVAVDLTTTNLLVVGAPRTISNNTLTEFGAVYSYIYTNNQWEQFGTEIRGTEDVFSANELFGSSVSASNYNRIVIGAPSSNGDSILLRGRVYVADYTTAWTISQVLNGQNANDMFGTSVDMLSDGTQFVVGAPGGAYAILYEYDGTIWNPIYTAANVGSTGFGSSVFMITTNVFAVGEPSYNTNQGRVIVYQKDESTGTFIQIGADITGAAGDEIGRLNTISGDLDASTSVLSITVATSTGNVSRFDFDSSTNTWNLRGTVLVTNFGTNLVSIASSYSSQELIVAGSTNAIIYELSA